MFKVPSLEGVGGGFVLNILIIKPTPAPPRRGKNHNLMGNNF
jgi:hypothetical protein